MVERRQKYEEKICKSVVGSELMETAVMLPLNTVGGRYAISRVAPYTTDRVLW